MPRACALAMGSLAMAMVMIRGALHREHIGDVAIESIIALFAFMLIGGVAGWIVDYLILDAVETRFRSRVDWYRQGINDLEVTQSRPVEKPSARIAR